MKILVQELVKEKVTRRKTKPNLTNDLKIKLQTYRPTVEEGKNANDSRIQNKSQRCSTYQLNKKSKLTQYSCLKFNEYFVWNTQ